MFVCADMSIDEPGLYGVFEEEEEEGDVGDGNAVCVFFFIFF